jgi:hypothetical protein
MIAKIQKVGNMCEQSNDPDVPSCHCADWAEIVNCLEEFPAPNVTIEEGDISRTDWVFRGLRDSRFHLEPAIERHAHSKTISWLALEKLVALEFKSRARMHLGAGSLPDPQDDLTWLALMQHHAIPTRLLDFTYSPFVALYFAIREQQNYKKRSHVRLWAINATEVNDRFQRMAYQAYTKARERAGGKVVKKTASLHLDDSATVGDSVDIETQSLRKLIVKSMLATGIYRAELERQGCVAVALPPAFDPRLASQQGVFLVNCAEELSFCASLKKMMAPSSAEWCKRFDISINAVLEIEQRLFQMNIHEQTLFPDMEGLAGFIRQKTRLHWE